MTDHDRPGPTQPDMSDHRHTLSIPETEDLLLAAGLVRSPRQIMRYCASSLLDCAKIPGPSGEQWYVAPYSVPKAIGDLREIEAQRDTARRRTMSDNVGLEKHPVSDSDMSERVGPGPTASNSQGGSTTTSIGTDLDRPGPTKSVTPDIDIFSHPYVLKLETKIGDLEKKVEAQVRETQKIQTEAFDKVIELQRMVQVGQSQTLADVFVKARLWLTGQQPIDPETIDPAQAPGSQR